MMLAEYSMYNNVASLNTCVMVYFLAIIQFTENTASAGKGDAIVRLTLQNSGMASGSVSK